VSYNGIKVTLTICWYKW